MAWSENDDISGQNTFGERSVALGVTYLLARAQTQAHADRIGCRDLKAAVDVPPSRDHRSRAVRLFQPLDPHWRAKGRDRLLDELHLILTVSIIVTITTHSKSEPPLFSENLMRERDRN